MKKIVALALAVVIVFSLAACGDEKTKNPTSSNNSTSGTSSINSEDNSSNSESSANSEVSNVTDSSNLQVQSPEINNSTSSSNATQDSNQETDTQGITTYERSWHYNAGAVCFPISGEYDDEADDMRKAILENKTDSYKKTGNIYYVSNNGNDDNDGTSPEKALATLNGVSLKNSILKPGDAVLFERNGIFRGKLFLKDGVYYGAYGEGVMPCIYGSRKNYVDSEWVSEGNNIWTLNTTFIADVGNIVFNHGEAVGYLKSSKDDLKSNYDFFCDRNKSNRVYLYLDKDPTKYFKSIEICVDGRIFDFDGRKDITVENITFKYTGGHALRGNNTSNITIRNCEIGYIGGSYLDNYEDGNVRYGNGVELIGNSSNTLVENCLIYQIYDSGITHQGDKCLVENFTARNNLIEYCGMGAIEYWHTKGAVMKNILYEGNMLRFAGYGFGGMQRPDKYMSACIMSNTKPYSIMYNEAENFVIKDNIFDLSTNQLLNLGSQAGTAPKLSGNTYVQVYGKLLGYYTDNRNVRFNTEVSDTIIDVWNDESPIIIAK